jgi:hypothetical protein
MNPMRWIARTTVTLAALVLASQAFAAPCPETLGPATPKDGQPGVFFAPANETHERAQTFTVVNAGRIRAIEIWDGRKSGGATGGNAIFDLRPAPLGIPAENSASALASVSLIESQLPTTQGWFRVEFGDAGPLVAVGDILALVVRTTSTWNVEWNGTQATQPGDVYPGGQAYTKLPLDGPAGAAGWHDVDEFFPDSQQSDYAIHILTCELAVPASPATWGSLKARYR